jgi:hypothetical protein
MSSRDKYLAIGLIVLIFLGIGVFLLSDDSYVSIYVNGTDTLIKSFSINVFNDNSAMNQEIYQFIEVNVNDVDSNVSTIRSDITEIAHNYGYNDVTVKIESQFGENQLPMMTSVVGRSMLPKIHDGEKIIVLKTKDINVGDVVVAKDDEFGLLIKRVGDIKGNNVFLVSDNVKETRMENGVLTTFVGVRKWTHLTNIVGIAKIYNVQLN